MPLPALGKVVRDCESARRKLVEAPNAVRDFWRARDAEHGRRPDFQLWRQLRGEDRFSGRLDGVVDLITRALRCGDTEVRWAALVLVSALPVSLVQGPVGLAAREALRSRRPEKAPRSCDWVAWLVEVWLGKGRAGEGEAQVVPVALVMEFEGAGWKAGRPLTLASLLTEGWLPVSGEVFRRWLARALTSVVRGKAPPDGSLWMVTVSLLWRDINASGGPRRAGQALSLLDASCLARAEGDAVGTGRLAALALAWLPERVPGDLTQRCQVAAWRVTEAGLALPERLRVNLEEIPFPGEPLESERGLEAARIFTDPQDASAAVLRAEAQGAGDWEVLRSAGVAVNHPLAALAWLGKKAPHHAVKRQYELLEAGVRLTQRHHCLVSAGKMLAVWPGGPQPLLAYAQAMRASLRAMPVLRNWAIWGQWAASLRVAWGRLEEPAITDEEALFYLNETLQNREQTTWRSLPEELRSGGAADALEANPRLLTALEHQRTVELWEVAALAREREDLAECVWVSLGMAGEAGAGRLQTIMAGPAGRKMWRARVRGALPDTWQADCAAAMAEVLTVAPKWVFLAVDEAVPQADWEAVFSGMEVLRVPSWEAAFRVLREGAVADLRAGWEEAKA